MAAASARGDRSVAPHEYGIPIVPNGGRAVVAFALERSLPIIRGDPDGTFQNLRVLSHARPSALEAGNCPSGAIFRGLESAHPNDVLILTARTTGRKRTSCNPQER
jgi:hypothetical protein